MQDDVYLSICRYEAMTGLSGWTNDACPDQADQDREMYGEEYGLLQVQHGYEFTSPARMVRFLVEVCGHSYQEAVDGIVEDFRNAPTMPLPALQAPEAVAREMQSAHRNILEALVDLKISRLTSAGDDRGLAYNWAVTRKLLSMRQPPNGR